MSTTQTNKSKRDFLKTIMMSFAFLSFGGLTSFFVSSPKSNSKGGYGGSTYGA